MNDKEAHNFYVSTAWQRKRQDILRRDHYECQLCKAKGKYSKAIIVHHVKHLRDAPTLSLSDTYTDDSGVEHRQLISVCRECHETVCHPERLNRLKKLNPLTSEKW